MKRVLTALLLVPVTLLLVWLVPYPFFALPVLVVAFLAVREFYDLAETLQAQPYRRIGFVATAVLVIRMELPMAAPFADPVLVACVLAILIATLLRPERLPHVFGDVGSTLVGLLYPGMLIALLGTIRAMPNGGAQWLTLLLVVVWLGDTTALYVGKLLGKHPMAPRISPNKTWEGAAASLAVAFLVAGGLGQWWRLGPGVGAGRNFLLMGLLGVALNVAAQIGDLVESAFKRAAQVKDSGGLLPGHGGVLDRMDAALFAAPVLWYYLTFLLT